MKQRWLVAVAAAVLLALPSLVLAYGVQSGEAVTIAKGEVKSGTFYTAGQTITIDGDIDGDLICAGSTVTVNGAVHGDVLCAGQQITINGPVDGSVRLAGQSVTVAGKVGRNASLAGQALTLGSDAKVAGDFGALAQTANLNGAVSKDVYGLVDILTLGGAIGSVDAQVGRIILGDNAKVAGDLRYTSETTYELDRSKVAGAITHRAPALSQAEREGNAARAGLAMRLYWILAALVAGLMLAGLLPRFTANVSQTMREKPTASIATGVIVSLLGPLLVAVIGITAVGLPLALMLAMAWALVIVSSSLFAGIALGQWLLSRADWHKKSVLWAAALGIPLAVILLGVPLVGGVVGLFMMWWGVGGAVMTARKSSATAP